MTSLSSGVHLGQVRVLDLSKVQVDKVEASSGPQDLVKCVYQRAGQLESVRFSLLRASLRSFALEQRQTSFLFKLHFSTNLEESYAYVKEISWLPAQKTLLQSIGSIELLAPANGGNYFKVPCRYVNTEKVKFGIFHAAMRYLEVMATDNVDLPGYIEFDINAIFTKDYRKLRVGELSLALGMKFKQFSDDVICQLRTSSQERKDAHKRWLKKG